MSTMHPYTQFGKASICGINLTLFLSEKGFSGRRGVQGPAKSRKNRILSLIAQHTLKGHADTIFSVAWSADGRVLASGSDNGTIGLWDGQTGQCLHTLEGHTGAISSVAWSADGSVLAS